MLEQLILPIILLLAGVYFLIRNVNYFKDESKLRNYLETSPKGKRWVNKFGLEKTVNLSKKYFLPLGIISSIGMILYTVYLLLILYNIIEN